MYIYLLLVLSNTIYVFVTKFLANVTIVGILLQKHRLYTHTHTHDYNRIKQIVGII